MRYLFLFLLISAVFWACQPEEACISSATSRLVLDFYVQTDSTPARDTIIVDKAGSTTTTALFYDSGAEGAADSISRLYLRLDPDQDSTVFYLQGLYNSPEGDQVLISDTLVFSYQRRYRLISPDCPLEVSFQELQLVRSTIDAAQVAVINTELVEPSDDTDVQLIWNRP